MAAVKPAVTVREALTKAEMFGSVLRLDLFDISDFPRPFRLASSDRGSGSPFFPGVGADQSREDISFVSPLFLFGRTYLVSIHPGPEHSLQANPVRGRLDRWRGGMS